MEQPVEFFKFGYYLKKMESADGGQASLDHLLDGLVLDDNQKTMLKIVDSNIWNDEEECMDLKQDVTFCLTKRGSRDDPKSKIFLQYSQHGQLRPFGQFVRPYLDSKLKAGNEI